VATTYPSRTKRRRAPRADVPELAPLDVGAEYLHVHPRTMRRMVAAGELTAYRVNRLIRIDMREVYALAQPVPPESVSP
jgi:excisionase family DNA binding protein